MNNPYNERYKTDKLYWGSEPSSLCDKLLSIIGHESGKSVLDIGCGEGRNSFYLAEHGCVLTAMDDAEEGLIKLNKIAVKKKISVTTIQADINKYSFEKPFDVIFSTGTVQYVSPDKRKAFFNNIQSITPVNGYHAISVLVKKPFIEEAPDASDGVELFYSGELLSYYRNWLIHYSQEDIFDCNSGGTPHRHAVNRMIAERIV